MTFERIASINLCTGCLQLYLEALPEDKGQWINKTKELRAQYEKIKETVRVPLCDYPQHDNKQVRHPKLQRFLVFFSDISAALL